MIFKICVFFFITFLTITMPTWVEEATHTSVTETLIDSQWPMLGIFKFIDSKGVISSSPKADSWAVGAGPELIVSPDGKRVAYWRSEKKKEWVVCDGKQERFYDGVDPRTITFSPDSKRLAYAAKTGKNWSIVVDGKEGKPYENAVGPLVFSPDNQHLAYAIKTGKKYAAVVDEKEGEQFDSCGRAFFSPDAQHLAYTANRGKTAFVVLDGVAGTAYDEILTTPIFSLDSKHVVYVAKSGKSMFVVLDGKEQKRYSYISVLLEPKLVFSPDSQHLVYTARNGASGAFLVIDGKEEKQSVYNVRMMVFSPDSSRFAYLGDVGKEWNVVVDGKETRYESIGPKEAFLAKPSWQGFVFSPDSKHVAFCAQDMKRNKKQFVVFDGIEQSLYDEIDVQSLAFSPDSSHLGYTARLGKKWFVVLDGKEQTPYDEISRTREEKSTSSVSDVLFSPDGNHSVYLAAVGEFNLVMVIDGKESSRIFYLVPNSSRFGPPDTFHYLAMKPTDKKVNPGVFLPGLFLVEEKMK